MPDSVLLGRKKVVFDEFVVAGFRNHLAELEQYIMGGCLRESGILDEIGARQILTEVKGGGVAACAEVWRALTSELWLHSLQQ